MKRCPDCAEDVKDEAQRCRFCGHVFAGTRMAHQRWVWRTNLEMLAMALIFLVIVWWRFH